MAGTFTIVQTNKNGLETIEHGTAMFPIQQYHNDFSIMDTVEWHWHPEFEAGIVRSGHLHAMINKEDFILSEGDGFFINAEILHADWDREDKSCLLDSIVFHPRLIGGNPDSVFYQDYISPILHNQAFYGKALHHNEAADQKLLALISQTIFLCDEQSLGYEFSVRNHLSELIYEIFLLQRRYTKGLSDATLRSEARIKTMLSFIEINYQRNITLQEIADSASVSKSECIRCFHKTIGRTPIQFLKEFRLQKAANLLRSTDLSISDIAFMCGFFEMSYFTRSFRAQYTDTPTQYRKKRAV